MTEYAPMTSWIRIMVGYAATTAVDRMLPVEVARIEGYQWFDRWLAAHDAEVKAEALERASYEIFFGAKTARRLRALAAEIEKEGDSDV